jgi:hypothetical protein
MRRLRITRWYWKLLYIGVSGIIVYAVAAVVADAGRGGDGPRGILRSSALFILSIVGSRLFRGKDEDIAEPRAWWRMTGGWIVGYILGLVWLVVTVGNFGVSIQQAGPIASAGSIQAAAALAIVGAVLTLLCVYSSTRVLLDHRKATRETDGPATQD